MDFSWPWVIGGWVIALVAGGGGFALIHQLFVRPKVFVKAKSWRLVPTRDDPRQKEAETILREQGLPTAVFEVKWWNAGRRTAKDIDVELTTPGEVLDISVDPETDDLKAPWEFAKPPPDYPDKNGLRIRQPELRPNGEVRATVGYEAKADDGEPEVKGYFEGQYITDVEQPSRTVLHQVPVFVTMAAAGTAIVVLAAQNTEPVSRRLAETTGELVAILVGAGLLGYLMGRWVNWMQNTVHQPPSERD